METLEGVLHHQAISHKATTFSIDGGLWLVSLFTLDDGRVITVAGEMNFPVFGWRYRLFGAWNDHPKHGRTFRFSSFDPFSKKSREGIVDYLQKYITSLGPHRAASIAEFFGEDTLDILRSSPRRIAEVPGIGVKTAEMVAERFLKDSSDIQPETYINLYDTLSPIAPPRHVINSLIRRFGADAEKFVRKNPYKLLDFPGLGFDRVDRLAVDHLGYPRDGEARHRAVCLEVLEKATANNGHTIIDVYTLRSECHKLIGCPLRDDCIVETAKAGQIVIDGDYIAPWWLDKAERDIVRHIRRLQATVKPLVFIHNPESGLDEDQSKIVEIFRNNAVSILEGVPGSGKSHTTVTLMKSVHESGEESIRFLAPTGKSAKMDKEYLAKAMPGSSIESTTIHRALECVPRGMDIDEIGAADARINRGDDGYCFSRYEENPMDETVYVCDEGSMPDVEIFAAMMAAIPDGSRLLITGDYKQLASVGPGAVLRDLTDMVPTVILDKPRRNSGSIARACWMVQRGIVPDPVALSRQAKAEGFPDNWVHVPTSSDEETLTRIVNTHINYIKLYGIDELKRNIQVISPQWDHPVGCNALNAAIREIATRPHAGPYGGEEGDDGFRLGDKVVRKKNGPEEILLNPNISTEELVEIFGFDEAGEMERDYWKDTARHTVVFLEERGKSVKKEFLTYKCYVVNGDFGEVIGFQGRGKGRNVIVRFDNPDRVCLLKPGTMHIMLAYATTVHKMQGSQYPIIMMPFSDFYWSHRTKSGIWNRETALTGMSRPIDQLITYGPIRHLADAIGRVTIGQRRTRLRKLMEDIREYDGPPIPRVRPPYEHMEEWDDEDLPF